MKKFGVVVVGPRKQSKRFALLCNKNKNNKNLGYPTKEKVGKNGKRRFWGVVKSSGDIDGWEVMCNEG
jgi:hypothetical protein